MPVTYALPDLYRGDSRAWQVELWDDAEETVPTDLAGATAAAQIRASDNSLADLACAITGPNVVDVALSAETARGLAVGRGSWDLEITAADGIVTTVLQGPIKVTADVTNSEA